MIVGGKWEGGDAALLESIRQYEDKILANWQLTPYNRPWSKCEGIDTDHIDNSKPVSFVNRLCVLLVMISLKWYSQVQKKRKQVELTITIMFVLLRKPFLFLIMRLVH